MKQFIAIIVFCLLTFPGIGNCALTDIKSPMSSGSTVFTPVHSNGFFKASVAEDVIENAICRRNYPQNGKITMRIYYECVSDECLRYLSQNFKEGMMDGTINTWSNSKPENVRALSVDTVFDLFEKKQIASKEIFYNKWGYLMGLVIHSPVDIANLDDKNQFGLDVANNLNKILEKKLEDAKNNPNSCLYKGR